MKRNQLIFYLIGAVVLVLLIQIIRSSFSNPGLERFQKDFKELGFFRNENNTGPVLRIYAIQAQENTSLETMREFSEAQPHTKYGKTLVFFFSNEVNATIPLSPKEPYFPSEFQRFLVAKFEKTPMGESRFESLKR